MYVQYTLYNIQCNVYFLLPNEMSLIHGFMGWQVGDLDGSTREEAAKKWDGFECQQLLVFKFWDPKGRTFLGMGNAGSREYKF